MSPPVVFSLPAPWPEDEWLECDRCAEVIPETETKTINDQCLCLDCQAELDPQSAIRNPQSEIL